MRKIRNDSVAKISCMDNDLQSLNFSWSNCMERRNLTKLRISAHNLAIETRRYTKNNSSNISDSKDKRLCSLCKTTESEFHFIFYCKLYDNERKNLVERLNEFTTLPCNASDNTFCALMSCLNGDLEVASRLCLFINNCFQIRIDFCNTAKQIDILLRPETTKTRSGRISKRPNVFDL